jgi:hypothetical protein
MIRTLAGICIGPRQHPFQLRGGSASLCRWVSRTLPPPVFVGRTSPAPTEAAGHSVAHSSATSSDPATGGTFELSNQYDHAWLNGANEYVMSDEHELQSERQAQR